MSAARDQSDLLVTLTAPAAASTRSHGGMGARCQGETEPRAASRVWGWEVIAQLELPIASEARRTHGPWLLSSSSDRAALDIVDGAGRFAGHGPHYSRRTPGSKTFTGVGREIVLVHESGAAVWACVYQRTPGARGTGSSRGRAGVTDLRARHIWRNMLFRNLGAGLSSELIISATEETYRQWLARYGSLPPERLRTEVHVASVRSRNPGFCYLKAGWERDRVVRGKLYLFAPHRDAGDKP